MATLRKRNGKWHVQVRRTGQPTHTKTFHRKADADAWANEMDRQADTVGLRPNLFAKHSAKILLHDLVTRYRDEICIHKKGYKEESYVLNRFLTNPICRKTLNNISKLDFIQYRDERLESLAPSTVKRQMAILSHMFEVALNDWGLIAANPLANFQYPKATGRRERRLRKGEWEALLKAARNLKNPFVAPVMQVALGTAMRRGEILRICWSHIDWSQHTLKIPETKNGLSRTIPLSDETVGLLADLRTNGIHADNFLFPLTANALRLNWQRACQRANIQDLRFHDLRHEAISVLFERGLSVPEVALISGHRDMRMLFHYTHPLVQSVRIKLNPASR